MENYEQKYKEALERASLIKDNNTVATPQEVAEFLFPELKETEDGKIRKEIIEYITRYKDCITDKEYDSWIAWLEKQGERTDYNPYKATIESIAAMVENYANNGDLKDFYNNVAVKCHDAIEYDKTWEKQGEQKADWSEEDEKFVVDTINFLYRAKNQYAQPVRLEECIDWIKSIKDRVQPQPKQEWSEDDKEILNKIIHNIEFPSGVTAYRKPIDEMVSWLESLKPNHWKPSEEQMRVLQIAIKDYGICHEKYVLESLYNNLKNL